MTAVLIVDDLASNRYLMRLLLEERGYTVAEAASGIEALAHARQHRPDAVVSDLLMPEMDGYETMQRIREDDGLSGIPLIAVTAKAMRGDRNKCLEAGADDYISKPVDIDLLLAVLRVAFDRASEPRAEMQEVEAAK